MVPTDPERKVACLTYDNADGKTQQVEHIFLQNVKIPMESKKRERFMLYNLPILAPPGVAASDEGITHSARRAGTDGG